jgi:hypothetical protein
MAYGTFLQRRIAFLQISHGLTVVWGHGQLLMSARFVARGADSTDREELIALFKAASACDRCEIACRDAAQ